MLNRERLLSIGQVGEMLQVSLPTVRRLWAADRMPNPVRVGRQLRWRESELQAWINGGCQPVGDSDDDEEHEHASRETAAQVS